LSTSFRYHRALLFLIFPFFPILVFWCSVTLPFDHFFLPKCLAASTPLASPVYTRAPQTNVSVPLFFSPSCSASYGSTLIRFPRFSSIPDDRAFPRGGQKQLLLRSPLPNRSFLGVFYEHLLASTQRFPFPVTLL